MYTSDSQNKKNTVKILIVDDNLKNLQITARILIDEGYLVSVAQNGETAFTVLEEEQCDLILLDIMMPGIDGYDVCTRLKSNTQFKDIPVIFLTAKSNTDNLVDGFKVGAVDFISKPFNRDELLMRIKTHSELALSRKKILELNKTRDKLYSIIAHDIRSPFNSIIQIIQAIDDGDIEIGSELYNSIFNQLRKSTSETSNLINNLLEWTKRQSETIEIKPTDVNIFQIINDCISLLKGNADSKNISINQDIHPNTQAFCDEISIYTVFRNLLSNAIKFTPEYGKIHFSSSSIENNITIHVKDTGIGISQEILDRIMISNEHYTTIGTKNELGSGLGLYFIKDFIEQNNGTLCIKSEIGKGSVFSISLPISA